MVEPVDYYLIDTNILVRSLSLSSPSCREARNAVKVLLRKGARVCIVPQNITELWNACTRPMENNGLGKSVETTDRYCRVLESILTLLPETPELYREWRSLVVRHGVAGAKVHDARLVAAMKVHRITKILTYNLQDFIRYSEIEAIHPQTIK
jgi:predicted nucleic acid-binding protein